MEVFHHTTRSIHRYPKAWTDLEALLTKSPVKVIDGGEPSPLELAGLAVLLQPNLGLTRRQQEMIAAVVSVENSCFY